MSRPKRPWGEVAGLGALSPEAARRFRAAYEALEAQGPSLVFGQKGSLRHAYVIDLMLHLARTQGVPFVPCVGARGVEGDRHAPKTSTTRSATWIGEPMRIGVITDLHFGREASYQGKLRKLGKLAPEAARRFVEAMNRDFRPDLVFHLGDMVQDMTLEEDKVHAAQCLEILGGSTSRPSTTSSATTTSSSSSPRT